MVLIMGLSVLIAVTGIALHRTNELPGGDRDSPGHELRAGPRSGSLSRVSKSPRERDPASPTEALRLLKELQESAGHSAALLQGRLSAIFRDWGRHDVDAAEHFLANEEAARGTFDGHRTFRDDLVFAVWMGLADVDPGGAWQRYVAMWKTLADPMNINPSMRPFPYETAGMHLFRVFYRSDPASALTWLRGRTTPMPIGPILRALMEETRDPDQRLRHFIEFCEGHLAGTIDLGFICAGVAMHDPWQAWEFVHRGRSDEGEWLTSESPETIAYEMIRFWSVMQPQRALDFIVLPELESDRSAWVMAFTMAQIPQNPGMVIRALEKEELAALRQRFSMEIYVSNMKEAQTSWPLRDEDIPLAPEERVLVVREALRTAGLPGALKTQWLEAVGEQ
jgi:hypothetical protein